MLAFLPLRKTLLFFGTFIIACHPAKSSTIQKETDTKNLSEPNISGLVKQNTIIDNDFGTLPKEKEILLSAETLPSRPKKISRDYLVAHVFVALCDNENQGIVPVKNPALGNGQKPETNLYWGAGYGVKSFFSKAKGWKRLTVETPSFPILERIAFQKVQNGKTLIVIADAYDGAYITETIKDFLSAAAGEHILNLKLSKNNSPEQKFAIQTGGYADLVAYVGHNALMDTPAPDTPQKAHDDNPKDAVILACIADQYFDEFLQKAGIEPLVWTTNLMAPEAYTLEAILRGTLEEKSAKDIQEMAASTYHKYQQCGIKAARRLFSGK